MRAFLGMEENEVMSLKVTKFTLSIYLERQKEKYAKELFLCCGALKELTYNCDLLLRPEYWGI